MKKNIYRILASAFALGLFAASPATSITTHALGFNSGAEDDTDYGSMPDNYWSSSSSSDSGSSSSSDSSSSHESSSNSGSHDSGSSNSGSGYVGGSSDNGSNGGGSASPAPVSVPHSFTTNAGDGQTFRIVENAAHTSYQVMHCGNIVAVLAVADADGNTVAYKTVAVAQGEDNLWYLNMSLADGVDATGYTVKVSKGDVTYLSTTLGVSGIKINGALALSTVPVQQ